MTSKVTATAEYGAAYREEFSQADGWTVTLRYQGRRMTVPFYKGFGHNGAEPTADEVMECLLLDASSADQDFEDWAADYGYDEDSRKAEQTYRQVQRQTARLRKLLGDDYEAMLYAEQDA